MPVGELNTGTPLAPFVTLTVAGRQIKVGDSGNVKFVNATGDQILTALTGILKDEDLVGFQDRLAAIPVNIEKQLEKTNAKIKTKQLELDAWKKANQDMEYQSWLKEVGKFQGDISKLQAEASTLNVKYANSVKSAAMVQGAVLDEAIRRTELSYIQER